MKDTTKNTKEPKKVCPHCNAKYPEEDNYCGVDGSRLEILDAKGGNAIPTQAGL